MPRKLKNTTSDWSVILESTNQNCGHISRNNIPAKMADHPLCPAINTEIGNCLMAYMHGNQPKGNLLRNQTLFLEICYFIKQMYSTKRNFNLIEINFEPNRSNQKKRSRGPIVS